MKHFLDVNGPVISFCIRLADLIELNIIYLLCCIPIITIGAATTSLQYVIYKIVFDKEDTQLFKRFFAAFRRNFKQSTWIWLAYLLLFILLAFDLYAFYLGGSVPTVVLIFIGFVAFFAFANMNGAFALLARFENPVKQTLKNSLIFSVVHFGKIVIITLLCLAPVSFFIWTQYAFPLILLIGFSGAAYLNAPIWGKIFSRYS